MIRASVLAFGLMLAFARKGRAVAGALAMVAAFAAAHAMEASGAVVAYLGGFPVSTLGLHLAGIGLASAVAKNRAAGVVQALMGAGIGGTGLWLMVG